MQLLATVKMNASELNDSSVDYDNSTFIGNQSFKRYDVNGITEPIIIKTTDVIYYIILALGIPGNILSAIVWLRRYVADRNSSAVYLAALAISDLIFQTSDGFVKFFRMDFPCSTWFCHCVYYPRGSAGTLEPLFVLAFSVEGLIAVIRPIQVCHLPFINYHVFTIL